MQQMAENLGLINPFLVTQLSTNSQSYSPQAALLKKLVGVWIEP